MKTRSVICIVMAAAMIVLLASCAAGSAGGVPSNLTGTPEEILTQLVDDLTNAGVKMPMSLPPTEVIADQSQNTIGLSEADFGRLVSSAWYNLAAIGTFAHQIIMIRANDAAAAAEVKRLVSGENGYDAKKWICVFPDKAAAVDSGEYVLLVASYNEVVDAVLETFEAAAGNVGDVITFWEFAGGETDNGGFGGGMDLMPMDLELD